MEGERRSQSSIFIENLVVGCTIFFIGALFLKPFHLQGVNAPVWPSAGIALVSLLLCGPRVVSGIFIGEFLVSLLAFYNGSENSNYLFLYMLLSSGATLQAFVGYILVMKYSSWPELNSLKNISIALFWAGPVACIIGSLAASFGFTHFGGDLYTFSLLNWFFWWSDDVLGVFLLLPVGCCIALFAGAPRFFYNVLGVCLPALGGLSLTMVLFLFTENQATIIFGSFISGSLGVSSFFMVCAREQTETLVEERTEALRRLNRKLANEVDHRRKIEEKLQDAGAELVQTVGRRTTELSQTYDSLTSEVEERRQTEKKLSRKAAELEAITSLGRLVSATLSVDGVVENGVNKVRDIVRPDSVMLFLREGEDLVPIAPEVKGEPERHIHKVGYCLCGLAAVHDEPVYSINIDKDDRCTWNECKNAGYSSFAALSLTGRRGNLGVLGLASIEERNFQEQSPFLEGLAQQIGLALENALFYKELQDQADVLEEKVRARTRELEEARLRAESADHLKSAFLASMSHELRTPLNSIIGFTGALLMEISGEMNDEQTKQLHMVQASANHLLSLVNDVLDLSKIEAGQLELSRDIVTPAEILGDVIPMIEPLAKQKNLTMEVGAIPDVQLETDRRRLEQVLINLLNNGVKFTQQGKLTVLCWVRNSRLHFTITDTGIGIDADDLPTIFDAFRQAESGLARQYEGTGLGLSICKKLIEGQGGAIEARSEGEGLGASFEFWLPLNDKENG